MFKASGGGQFDTGFLGKFSVEYYSVRVRKRGDVICLQVSNDRQGVGLRQVRMTRSRLVVLHMARGAGTGQPQGFPDELICMYLTCIVSLSTM